METTAWTTVFSLALLAWVVGSRFRLGCHYFLIFFLVFRTPVLNQAAAVLMLLVLFQTAMVRGAIRRWDWGVLLLGAVPFVSRLICLLTFDVASGREMVRDVGVNMMNSLGLAVLMMMSLRDASDVRRILLFYATVRVVECGAIGMWGYFNPRSFWELRDSLGLVQLTDANDLVQHVEFEGARLEGLVVFNAVDAAFHLCVALSIIGVERKWNLLDIVMMSVASCACVFTWARTALVGGGITLFYIFLTARRHSRYRAAAVVAVFVATSIFLFGRIIERMEKDDRLASSDNITFRLGLHATYLGRLAEIGPFGVGLPEGGAAGYLKVPQGISSEHLFLQATVDTGILGGFAFLAIVSVKLVGLIRIGLRVYRGRGVDLEYLTALEGTFIVGMMTAILGCTFLLKYNEPVIWLFIGCASVLIAEWRLRYQGNRRETKPRELAIPETVMNARVRTS